MHPCLPEKNYIRLLSYSALLLALTLPSAVSAGSPWMTGEMSARISFSGEIDIERTASDSRMNWIEASFYLVPQESQLQSRRLVSASPDYDLLQDDFGNDYIKFRWENPQQDKLNYEIIWDVDAKRLQYAITDLASAAETPSGIENYLQADNLSYWTGFMKAKAESLVDGSESRLESSMRLSSWVNRYVTYDLSLQGSSLSAENVFHGRRGVCGEFTRLFISLARSIGIPVRYVEGLVFSGEEWNFHAWAELYSDNWLPVDPTYNEAAFIDSSHIYFAKAPGSKDLFNRLSWEGIDVKASFGEDEFSVDVFETKAIRLMRSSLSMPREAGAGELARATASLTNLANSYIVATCSLSMPVQMRLLDGDEKSILIEPHGSAELSWHIATPDDMDAGFLHRMPVRLLCFPGLNESAEITIDPRLSGVPFARASISDLTALNQSHVLVSFRNEGTMELEDIIVSLCPGEAECRNISQKDFRVGEARSVFFSGLSLSEGDSINAHLISPQSNTSSAQALIPSLQDAVIPEPRRPEIPNTIRIADEDTETILLILVLMISAMLVIAIITAIVRKR
jgi:transglutaminase-like putative cysteine protease